MLMSRAAQMNPVAIFVGLLFWSWVWGLWGTMLAVPMLMMIKAVCDHVEDLAADRGAARGITQGARGARGARVLVIAALNFGTLALLALWHFGTLAPWRLAPWHFGTLALWTFQLFGTLAPWHFGTCTSAPLAPLAPWHPWHRGTLAPWHLGTFLKMQMRQ